jgi:hypothetical protein
MGYHYVKPSLLGQPPDLRRPSVLLYLPTGDGLKLGGVEWVQADADQDPTTDTDRPSLLGVPFAGPMPGHGPRPARPLRPARVGLAEQPRWHVRAVQPEGVLLSRRPDLP